MSLSESLLSDGPALLGFLRAALADEGDVDPQVVADAMIADGVTSRRRLLKLDEDSLVRSVAGAPRTMCVTLFAPPPWARARARGAPCYSDAC